MKLTAYAPNQTKTNVPNEQYHSGLVMVLLILLSHLGIENKRLRAQVANLEAALKLERAKRFGDSSERNTGSEKEEAKVGPAPEAETDKKSPMAEVPPKKQRGGQPGHKGRGRTLPPELPREETFYDLSPDERRCPDCNHPYAETTLTEDSEEIEVQVKAHVRRYRRKRYRKQCSCSGPRFITAPVPPKVIPKGKFSVATWVKFLLDKYQAQIPVTRQLQQLEQIGLTVAKSTVTGGFRKLYDLLLPLYEHFLSYLRTTQHLHADETGWRVFEEVAGKANHRWWLWLFASRQLGVVVFVLDPSRSANVPKKQLAEPLAVGQPTAEGQQINQIDGKDYLLSDTLEIISADRLRVYQAISELVKVAFCWAHQRRDFTDFRKSYAGNPILVAWADSWLADIAQLYALNQQRLAVRNQPQLFQHLQTELEAAIAAMKRRIFARQGLSLAQEKILLSLQRHWSGLTLFVSNPDIPMDNNWAERLLRGPVVGRKNYYGHRAQWAGELGAMVFSIVETCRLNGLNPFQFLLSYFNACAELGGPPPDLSPFSPWLNRDRSPP